MVYQIDSSDVAGIGLKEDIKFFNTITIRAALRAKSSCLVHRKVSIGHFSFMNCRVIVISFSQLL